MKINICKFCQYTLAFSLRLCIPFNCRSNWRICNVLEVIEWQNTVPEEKQNCPTKVSNYHLWDTELVIESQDTLTMTLPWPMSTLPLIYKYYYLNKKGGWRKWTRRIIITLYAIRDVTYCSHYPLKTEILLSWW